MTGKHGKTCFFSHNIIHDIHKETPLMIMISKHHIADYIMDIIYPLDGT